MHYISVVFQYICRLLDGSRAVTSTSRAVYYPVVGHVLLLLPVFYHLDDWKTHTKHFGVAKLVLIQDDLIEYIYTKGKRPPPQHENNYISSRIAIFVIDLTIFYID